MSSEMTPSLSEAKMEALTHPKLLRMKPLVCSQVKAHHTVKKKAKKNKEARQRLVMNHKLVKFGGLDGAVADLTV